MDIASYEERSDPESLRMERTEKDHTNDVFLFLFLISVFIQHLNHYFEEEEISLGVIMTNTEIKLVTMLNIGRGRRRDQPQTSVLRKKRGKISLPGKRPH
jgi:hypothetical protein